MKSYVNKDYLEFNTLEDCLGKVNGKEISVKNILKREPKLLILQNDKVINEINSIQPLYLYPTTILDYIYSIKQNNSPLSIVSLNLIKYNSSVDYVNYFNTLDFNILKNIELNIKEKLSEDDFSKIIILFEYIKNKTKISVNFKTFDLSPNQLIRISLYCDYFKIFLSNILNNPQNDEFKKNLNIINKNKKSDALIHIKTYLNIEQVDYYEAAMKDFNENGVDIFQVSKELIPINQEINIEVPENLQNKVRNLEQEYSTYNKTKFISVKDISVLYYPRFELNGTNSRKCYASMLKPYIYDNYLLPCKVNKVLSDINYWNLKQLGETYNHNVIKKCGMVCDDCASIFENDILKQLEKYQDCEFILEIN